VYKEFKKGAFHELSKDERELKQKEAQLVEQKIEERKR
jgi:hypothetical protein